MRITRCIGVAAVTAAMVVPAARATAGPTAPPPPTAPAAPGLAPGAAPGPAPGPALQPAPEAVAPAACTYVVESGIYTCDDLAMSRLATATTVVAALFPAKGYAGAPSLTIRSEKGGCTSGKLKSELRVDLRYLYFVDGRHWDDKAMSLRTYNGCLLKLFDGSDGREGRMTPTRWIDDTTNLAGVDGHNWGRRADLIAVS